MRRLPPNAAIAAVLVALAACAQETPGGPAPAPPMAPAAPLPSALAAPPPPTPSAASPTDPAPAPAAATAAPAIPVVDTPPWPETNPGAKAKLTWVVYPEREVRERGGFTHAVRRTELVVRVGATTRRVELGDFAGGLWPDDQHVCVGRLPPGRTWDRHVVGQIAFTHSDADGVTARRETAGALTLVGWTAFDGICEDAHGKKYDCDPPPHTIAVVPIPADAQIEEALVEVDGPGREHPYDGC